MVRRADHHQFRERHGSAIWRPCRPSSTARDVEQGTEPQLDAHIGNQSRQSDRQQRNDRYINRSRRIKCRSHAQPQNPRHRELTGPFARSRLPSLHLRDRGRDCPCATARRHIHRCSVSPRQCSGSQSPWRLPSPAVNVGHLEGVGFHPRRGRGLLIAVLGPILIGAVELRHRRRVRGRPLPRPWRHLGQRRSQHPRWPGHLYVCLPRRRDRLAGVSAVSPGRGHLRAESRPSSPASSMASSICRYSCSPPPIRALVNAGSWCRW